MLSYKIKLFIIFVIYLTNIAGFAQNFNKEKLDTYFNTLEKYNKFMGSVAVSKDGNLIYSKSVGYSNVDNKIKANEHTTYKIGSISKTFTSVLVFKAIEKRKLKLNQTIDVFFPNLENAKSITIKHLLYHQSGIFNFTNKEEYLTWNLKPKSRKEMLEIISKNASTFKPGSNSEYSNSNYLLLSYILEDIFKKPYSEILDYFIVKPLNLTRTYLGNFKADNLSSSSYTFAEYWTKEPETDVSITLGGGGIVSNPTDLVKFSDALFSNKIVKAKSLKKMKKLENNFGAGLFRFPFYNKKGYGHTGGIDSYFSIFIYFPDEKISYALTSNGLNYALNNISIAVLSAIYDKPYEIPVFTNEIFVPKNLDIYTGVYSSKQIPLKITITKENNILIAQATGQPSFKLQASAIHEFRFDLAGVVMVFNPENNSMILKQSGAEFNFFKE